MASSNFTPNLGLCNWSADDRPKRMDFVSDNNIIDERLGNHLNNSDIHVTADEKERITAPYEVMVYAGDGESSKTFTLDKEYNMAIVFQKNKPMVEFDANKNAVCRFAISGVTLGSSSGVTLSKNSITVKQSGQADDGMIYNFNESFGQYVILLFR